MSIYATVGVPEVWRVDNRTLTFHALDANQKYQIVSRSLSFPLVTAADLMGFLALCVSQNENRVLRQFRAWIRQQLPGSGTVSPAP
jgi:hypothetical protein